VEVAFVLVSGEAQRHGVSLAWSRCARQPTHPR
jgi:hypothetical protein